MGGRAYPNPLKADERRCRSFPKRHARTLGLRKIICVQRNPVLTEDVLALSSLLKSVEMKLDQTRQVRGELFQAAAAGRDPELSALACPQPPFLVELQGEQHESTSGASFGGMLDHGARLLRCPIRAQRTLPLYPIVSVPSRATPRRYGVAAAAGASCVLWFGARPMLSVPLLHCLPPHQ